MSSRFKKITEVVFAFIEADSWSDSQEIVKQERELLFSEEADLVLGNLLEQYKNDAKMTKMLVEHQALLKECKVNGIEAAFTNKMSQRIPLALPPELTSRLLAVRSEEEMNQLTQSHPEIQAALDKLANATRQALAEFMAEHREENEEKPNAELTPEKRQGLANKLKLFISKETLDETEAYLGQHPELVTEEGLAVMDMLVERAERTGDDDIINLFMLHHDILADALDEKVDIELAEFFSDSVPMNIWDILNELIDCETYEEVSDLVEDYPELLSDYVDNIIEQSIAHARVDGHLGGEKWADYLQARRTTLRKLRKRELENGK